MARHKAARGSGRYPHLQAPLICSLSVRKAGALTLIVVLMTIMVVAMMVWDVDDNGWANENSCTDENVWDDDNFGLETMVLGGDNMFVLMTMFGLLMMYGVVVTGGHWAAVGVAGERAYGLS